MGMARKRSWRFANMLSRSTVEAHFDRGIQRSRGVLALHNYLLTQTAEVHDLTDMLRSCIVIASSAFDLLHHHMIRALTQKELASGSGSQLIAVPVKAFALDITEQQSLIDDAVRGEHSHKSYLMPDKIGGLYSSFIENFWSKVADEIGASSPKQVTLRIRELGRWRNRIVHESDINPDLGGIEEWPVVAADVYAAVDTYQEIGKATIKIGLS